MCFRQIFVLVLSKQSLCAHEASFRIIWWLLNAGERARAQLSRTRKYVCEFRGEMRRGVFPYCAIPRSDCVCLGARRAEQRGAVRTWSVGGQEVATRVCGAHNRVHFMRRNNTFILSARSLFERGVMRGLWFGARRMVRRIVYRLDLWLRIMFIWMK